MLRLQEWLICKVRRAGSTFVCQSEICSPFHNPELPCSIVRSFRLRSFEKSKLGPPVSVIWVNWFDSDAGSLAQKQIGHTQRWATPDYASGDACLAQFTSTVFVMFGANMLALTHGTLDSLGHMWQHPLPMENVNFFIPWFLAFDPPPGVKTLEQWKLIAKRAQYFPAC